MKNFSLIFFCFFYLSRLIAQDCNNPIIVQACPGYTYNGNLFAAQSDNIKVWRHTATNGLVSHHSRDILLAGQVYNEAYIDVTIAAAALDTPRYICFTLSNANQDVSISQIDINTNCASLSDTIDVLQYALLNRYDTCYIGNAPYLNKHFFNFPILGTGTYRFVLEGLDIENIGLVIGVITNIDTTSNPIPSCSKGTFAFDARPLVAPIPDTCPFTPFRSSSPYYELCLNGTVIATDDSLTFNLGVTNQLCVKTYFKNLSGTSSLRDANFYFGPALDVVPMTRGCTNSSTPLLTGDLLPLLNNTDNISNSGWNFSTSPTAILPSNVPLSYQALLLNSSIKYKVINSRGDGRSTCPAGGCQQTEFCFEVISANNIPDSTKVLAIFTPDGWTPQTTPTIYTYYGCHFTLGTDCSTGGGGSDEDASLFIDFEDPAPIILATELLYFNAVQNENQHILTWAISPTNTVARMFIERSADGIAWQSIENILVDSRTTYTYIDKFPIQGQNYYRIKEEAIDGTISFSPTRVLESQKKNTRILLFPNPTKGTFAVHGINNQEPINVELFTADGRKVALSAATTTEANQLLFDISNFERGLYIVKIWNGYGYTCHKLIKE